LSTGSKGLKLDRVVQTTETMCSLFWVQRVFDQIWTKVN